MRIKQFIGCQRHVENHGNRRVLIGCKCYIDKYHNLMPMLEHHHLLPCSLNTTGEMYILPI